MIFETRSGSSTFFLIVNAMSNYFVKRYHQLAEEQEQYIHGTLPEEWKGKRALHCTISFVRVLYKEIMRDRLFARASALAYTMILSLIPMLVVGGSIVLTFNKNIKIEDISGLLHDYVTPVTGETISKFLAENVSRAIDIGTGPIGAIALIVTTVMLFIQIEGVFNDIWQVKKSRTLYLQILIFYAIVTLGPIILSISIYQAAQVLEGMPFASILSHIAIFISGLAFIFLILKLLPSTKVSAKIAIIPAILVTISFEVLKYGFKFFVMMSLNSKYSILYGALGLAPMVLVWIYVLWVVVLIGVECCFCAQNLKTLLYRNKIDMNESDGNKWFLTGSYAPFEILACLVRGLEKEKLPLSCDDIAECCNYPTNVVEAILEKLDDIGITKSVETDHERVYLLARPLERIDLWKLYRHFDDTQMRISGHPNFQELINSLFDKQESVLDGKTARSLMEYSDSDDISGS